MPTDDIEAHEHIFKHSNLDNIEVIVGNSLEYLQDIGITKDPWPSDPTARCEHC